jgi:hypothetical protein
MSRPVEITLHADKLPANPFVDITLDADKIRKSMKGTEYE